MSYLVMAHIQGHPKTNPFVIGSAKTTLEEAERVAQSLTEDWDGVWIFEQASDGQIVQKCKSLREPKSR